MYAILSLSLFGIATLLLGLNHFFKERIITLATFFILVVIGLNLADWNKEALWFNNLIRIDNTSILFSCMIAFSTLFILLSSVGSSWGDNTAEFSSLLLLASVGGMLMTTFESMMILFVGIEILSIASYILVGSDKHNLRSNEAVLRYFLMGSFASAIFLFGITFIYGATGSFNIHVIQLYSRTSLDEISILYYIGILITIVGLLFKVSIAPFHFWTADVYEGSPTLFTGFMATVVKIAGFAAIYKLLDTAFSFSKLWYGALIFLSIGTLLVSNISAIYQTSFKRTMAYSSISHAGYLLLACLVQRPDSESAILFYLLSYVLATLVTFVILEIISIHHTQKDFSSESYDAFNGLAKKNPVLAFCMSVAMFSLAGIPLTAGFWGKFFVFNVVIQKGLWWVLIYGILMSTVSIYYYFKIIWAMYTKKLLSEEPFLLSIPVRFLIIFATFATVILGLMPRLAKDLF